MIGLTRFIEIITINSIDEFNFGRNQFDLIDPDEKLNPVKFHAGKLSIKISNYSIYRRNGTTLTPITPEDNANLNETIVFIRTEIATCTRKRLEQLVDDVINQRAGQARFPYILPSRGITLR